MGEDSSKATVAAIDFDALTHADLEFIEDYTRMTFADLLELMRTDRKRLPFRAVTAFTFLGARAVRPDLTIDDVRNAKVGEFELDLSGGDADPLSETAAKND